MDGFILSTINWTSVLIDTKTEEGMSSVAEIADGGNVNLCVSHFSSSPTFDEYIVFGPGTRKLLCNINLIKTL